VLSGRGLCDELITRPEESYRKWCVVLCDLETSWMRRPWPTGGLSRQKQINKFVNQLHKNTTDDLTLKFWHANCAAARQLLPYDYVATPSICYISSSSSSSSSSSCSWRIRRVSYSLILKMKLVPPPLPRSSYVPSSFWSILWRLFWYDIYVNCSWVVSRWQYTFTHKQYIEQHK
jgi:hypothetical protein